MARKSSVRYWSSRGGYCCWHRGRQHVLAVGPDDFPEGPTYKAAMQAFLALAFPPKAGEESNLKTVATVLNLYRQYLTSKAKPETVVIKEEYFSLFERQFGHKVVQYLRSAEVEEWLAEMRKPRWSEKVKRQCGWGDGSVRNAIDCLNAAFRWAIKREYISRNPISAVERVAGGSRSEDAVIEPDDHARVLRAAKGDLRDFIVCLEATGCRPGELANATAAHFDPMLPGLVYRAKPRDGGFRHKTAHKNRDRRIILTGEALAIIKRRVVKYPKGSLFPRRSQANTRRAGTVGQGWSPRSIVERFEVLRKKVRLPNLTAYSYRHTFATRWLRAGRSVEKLAVLMGNTPAVIHKHYSHIIKYSDELRAELEALRNTAPAPVPSMPQESVQMGPHGVATGIMED